MDGGALVAGSVRVLARGQAQGGREATASSREERRRVQSALAAQGPIAERDHRGNTPLHAVYAGVKTKDIGPSDLWSFSEDYGGKETDFLKTLLDADADPNARNKDGDTPMMLLLKEKAPVFTHLSHLRLHLAAGADPDTRDGKGTPAVIQAILSQSRSDLPDEGSALVAALLKAGADPDLRDRRGDTPLVHVAKFKESIRKELKVLLAGRAEPRRMLRKRERKRNPIPFSPHLPSPRGVASLEGVKAEIGDVGARWPRERARPRMAGYGALGAP